MEPRDPKYKNAIITIPNLICFGRLIGSPILILLAFLGMRYWFVACFLMLSLSDWIDGKLARWLHQRSELGARLDSFADATLYASMITGALVLSYEQLQHELIWLGIGLGSYVMTTGAGLLKFRKVPSYHTYGAKFTQWLALIAGVALVLNWSVWPMRIAAISVTLTNIEATIMTCMLKKWHADILTIFHIWPKNRLREIRKWRKETTGSAA